MSARRVHALRMPPEDRRKGSPCASRGCEFSVTAARIYLSLIFVARQRKGDVVEHVERVGRAEY